LKWTRTILLAIGIGLVFSSLLMLISPPAAKKEINLNHQQIPAPVANSLPKQTLKKPNPPMPKEKIIVIIPEGTDSEKIARILAEEGVINSAQDFSQLAETLKVEKKFRAGQYTFEKEESLTKVLKKLIKGSGRE